MSTSHDDARALLDQGQGTATPRRAVLGAMLGAGYAAVAGPVQAQTAIKTPADGLVTGETLIDTSAGGKLPMVRSAPAGRTGLPVVLVVSEIFGVHEYIADVTRRLAREGYLAIAPELFFRQGDTSSYGEMAKLMAEVVNKTPDQDVMRDLDACVAWAAANGGDVSRLAITGFCWGGRHTWLYAAHQPRVKAAVAWYGRLVGAPSPVTPSHPIDHAAKLHAPVLGLYGGADTGIPLASVEQMKAALQAPAATAASRASQFVVYPDTPHAFHADYRPSFRQGPAEDGWKRMLQWLRQHGVA
jgi:carboxymethylenebutenolidase